LLKLAAAPRDMVIADRDTLFDPVSAVPMATVTLAD